MKINKNVRYLVQAIVVAVIFYFLIKNLYTNWLKVRTYEWHFNYVLLAISFCILLGVSIFMIVVWRHILEQFNAHLPFKKAFKIWFLSSLGRYIPGKVWQVMGMAYLTNKEGIRAEISITSAVLAQSLSFIPGMILGLFTIMFLIPDIQLPGWVYLSLILVPVSIIIVYPPYLEKLINMINRALKRSEVHISATFTGNLFTMFLYLCAWVVYGLAFFLFTRSITFIDTSHIFSFFGIFAGAYIIGLIAVFVPGGLGVREGILAALLSAFFPFPVAVAIAFGSRIWITCAELLCVVVALRL